MQFLYIRRQKLCESVSSFMMAQWLSWATCALTRFRKVGAEKTTDFSRKNVLLKEQTLDSKQPMFTVRMQCSVYKQVVALSPFLQSLFMVGFGRLASVLAVVCRGCSN